MAQSLDRAGFDFIMLEDKLAIPEAYGGSFEVYLKHALGMAPKHDRISTRDLARGIDQKSRCRRYHVHARLSAVPPGAPVPRR